MTERQPSPRAIFRNMIRRLLEDHDCLSVSDLYEYARLQHPILCDDSIRCTHGTDEPEWRHQLRFGIWDLKSKNIIIEDNGRWRLR